ncbi:MAG: ABC transporter ATP-binding protein [Alphaproteobacteria bacterium]
MDRIVKFFDVVRAVNDVSLEVADEEFVALLGPSGCGKTTTLRLIAGLEVADGGRIHIADREVTNLHPRDRDVAMVFQDYALYPHMTVRDNIGYPLKVRGVARERTAARVAEVAERLQIGQLLERRPGQLSGGQQQRASVARALVHRAQVFLFDEPLSNLDAKLRIEARAFIKRLQKEIGITAIYVTHDQAEAMALADRIVVMREGDIMQIGSPNEVYRRPMNTFVASFMGSPPMNLLPCRLDLGRAGLVFDDSDVTLDLDGIRQHLPASLADGAALYLGIRPEHLRISAHPAPATIPGKVFVVEPLGAEIMVLVTVGSQLVSVRLLGDEVPELAESVWLGLDADRLYFYGANGMLLR